jgi:branched-chain amino acid transport system ATP-binding protein
VSAAAASGASAAPLLELESVSAGYGPVQALSAVSIRVMPGEIVTLIGANGAGKSTLLMTICGDPRPRAGRVLLEGRNIAGLPTHAIIRMGLAQSPEGRRVFPRMTVGENLQMGGETLGAGDRAAALAEVFALFPRLQERMAQRAGTLSGGEQQMLAIGRALMSRPRLLLLDEPSLGLAPLIVRQIFGAIRDLNAKTGLTVLLVEQNANLALRLAHRGYVLVNGRIAMEGTGAELLARPEVRDAYLGGGGARPPEPAARPAAPA